MAISRLLFSAPVSRLKRLARSSAWPAEVLEDRQLLSATIVDPGEGLDLVGRDRWGNWWKTTPVADQQIFAKWNPAANWQHVVSGDFDGDGFIDIAGWDPASGMWWTSLSDPIGSTTLYSGAWSNATTWSDVAVANLNGDGLGQDIAGRDAWGNWWGAIANGDGTFHNVLLTTWSATAGWRDAHLFDLNRDSTTDIVARASDGSWWAAVRLADGSYLNLFLANWDESAGWKDSTVLSGFDDPSDGRLGDYRTAVVARSAAGEWWALSGRADGSIDTRYLVTWDETKGWHDVLAANMIGDYSQPPGGDKTGEEIVGRTSSGDWYALDPRTLKTSLIGHWNEAAGWRDVQVIDMPTHNEFDPRNYDDTLIGRTANGVWWSSGRDGVDPLGSGHANLVNRQIAYWNPNGGWRDAFATDRLGGVRAEIKQVGSVSGSSTIVIYGHRAGVSVTIIDLDAPPPPDDPFAGGRVSIHYVVPSSGYEETFVMTMPRDKSHRISFLGRSGRDSYISRSRFTSIATMGAGDDFADVTNSVSDLVFGGDGLDVLLGDTSDNLTQ
jgi:hypothetical protein